MTAPQRYTIALARARDLPALPAIERAAARLLVGQAPESILDETTSDEELRAAQRLGHLWVALLDDQPVGFAHVKILEARDAHLEELDVLPEHGRRGLGTQLVTAVCAWAAGQGYESMTLTTFRDVPFNMPFYESLGFAPIPDAIVSPALRALVNDEMRRGLDPSNRVVMRRSCQADSTKRSASG
jgi:GNAT superfamily N-acetyltransferase